VKHCRGRRQGDERERYHPSCEDRARSEVGDSPPPAYQEEDRNAEASGEDRRRPEQQPGVIDRHPNRRLDPVSMERDLPVEQVPILGRKAGQGSELADAAQCADYHRLAIDSPTTLRSG
jgi:hypothetical protein